MVTLYFRRSFALCFATFALLLLPLQAAQDSKEQTLPRPLLKGMCDLRITINPNDNNMPKNFEDIKIYTEKGEEDLILSIYTPIFVLNHLSRLLYIYLQY